MSIAADSPMRIPVVPAAPSTGNNPFAMAAPPCTLTIAPMTAGIGGSARRLRSFMPSLYRVALIPGINSLVDPADVEIV